MEVGCRWRELNQGGRWMALKGEPGLDVDGIEGEPRLDVDGVAVKSG